MPFELKDVKITHLSLVGKGANGKTFAIAKSKELNVQREIKIAKSDEAKKIVYGVVYEPSDSTNTDAHDDFMTAEEIEKSAHAFMEAKNTYNIDKQHDLQADEGYVVESYIAPSDMTLGEQEIKKGSWIAGVKVTNDETWAQIQKGEITGFSMWGQGKRVEVGGSDNIVKAIMNGFSQIMSKFATKDEPVTIAKAVTSFKSRMQAKDVKNKWNQAIWACEDTLYEVMNDSEIENKITAVEQTIGEFKTVMLEIAAQWPATQETVIGKSEDFKEKFDLIRKAGKAISTENEQLIDEAIAALTAIKNKTTTLPEGETEMKVEDITKAVESAIAPIAKQVTELAEEVTQLKKEDAGASESPTTTEGQGNELSQAVAKALEPLQTQITNLSNDVQVLKNHRGSSFQPPDSQTIVSKSEVPSYISEIVGGN